MTRVALPDRLVLRLAPGRAREDIAAHRDVRLGRAQASTDLDEGGELDRTFRRRAGGLRASRAFVARRSVSASGHRHLGWDALEEEIGFSRTLRIELEPGADLEALLADLVALEQVEMVSPQYLCETPFALAPPAPGAPRERGGGREDWGRAMIGAAEALALEPGDTALILGLVDSGVVREHPELTGRLRPGLNTVSDGELAASVDVVTRGRARGQDVDDDQGHGTCCAGILVANGYRIPRGIAGAARLLPLRALCGARLPESDRPVAVGSLVDLDSAFKSVVDLGARVVNLSFGTPETALRPDDPVPHAELVRYALAHDCVLVAASGNGGDRTRYFPAALPGVLAVGAVGPERRPSRFTSRGPHVAISAPGEQLSCAGLGGYATVSGTSFAAPLVAGACALLLARAARHSVALPVARVRDLLLASAAPFATGSDVEGCGRGILDVPAALRAVEEECLSEAA
jgi:subtilisin family serine protease